MNRVQIAGDTTPEEVVRRINRRSRFRNFALPGAAAISAGLITLFLYWPAASVAGFGAMLVLSLLYRRLTHTVLLYGNEDETTMRLDILQQAVTALVSANSVWSVREASLTNGLKAQPPTLARVDIPPASPSLPNHVISNIRPPAVKLPDSTLYFLPERLLVWQGGRFMGIEYSQLKVGFGRVNFLERETRPADAALDSSMRRSLTNDQELPILYYGLVDISAPNLQTWLMTSSLASAQEFATRMQALTRREDRGELQESSKEHFYTHFDPDRVPLFYWLSDDDIKKLQAIRRAFASIVECDCVWCYDGEAIDDLKRWPGEATLVRRLRVSPSLIDQAPGFESNVAFGLSIGASTLMVLPDGFVTLNKGCYEPVTQILTIKAGTCNFLEREAAPRDAEVIGSKADDNRQLTIYRYGQLELRCGSWRLHLCLSRASAATEFAAAMQALTSQKKQSRPKERAAPPRRPVVRASAAAVAAFRVLGLPIGASMEEASAAYKSLAAQNHPDKVANMAREFRDLAERKMRELNAAYEQVRQFLQARH